MRSVRLSAILLSLVVASSQLGCAREETTTPLYEARPLELDIRFTTEVETQLPMTVIEPNLVKRLLGKFFKWFPVLGDLIEIPIDAATALVPKLTTVMHPEIPENATLTDPEVLDKLESVVFVAGALSIVPESRRGKDYVPETCVRKKCPEIGFSFLEQIRIYLLFDPNGATDGDDKIRVLLGTAERKLDYDAKRLRLKFRMSKTDLKPYLEKYGPFQARVVAEASIPSRAVYFEGAFKVKLAFKIQGESDAASANE